MRITNVTTIPASRMHGLSEQWVTDRYRSIKADIAVVVVETDTDVTGVGEACSYGNPLQIADWVRWYAPTLIGAELDDPGIVPRPTGTSLVHARGSAHDFAVAGIDSALWDARGKAAGLPVRLLLNPAADETVEVYASGGVRYDWRRDPGSLVDDVLGYVAAGYRTVKFRLGTAWEWDAVTPARFIGLVDAVIERLPVDVAFAVDGNSRLTREQALIVALELEDRGAAFLEEPMSKKDLEGYVALNAAVGIPISGGESFATIEQFRPWLEAGAFDIVQPDAGVCGITEVMRIGALAERHDVSVIPHSWHNGLMAMANAHAVAALPNARMVEECMVQGPLKWDVLQEGNRVRDGRLELGDSPGLGVTVIDDLAERFPYVEGHYSVEVFR